jgi:hypothetical protein
MVQPCTPVDWHGCQNRTGPSQFAGFPQPDLTLQEGIISGWLDDCGHNPPGVKSGFAERGVVIHLKHTAALGIAPGAVRKWGALDKISPLDSW